MAQTALRPRYSFTSACEPKELWAIIKKALRNPKINSNGLVYRSVATHFIISYPKEQHHFWSPTLDLNFDQLAKNKTRVRALLGPEPAIWTLFMFGYAVAALAIMAGIVLGYSQYILGQSWWLFSLIPAGTALVVFLLFASYFGKHQAEAQTEALKVFLETALGHSIETNESAQAVA
jgi:hypothetical protein